MNSTDFGALPRHVLISKSLNLNPSFHQAEARRTILRKYGTSKVKEADVHWPGAPMIPWIPRRLNSFSLSFGTSDLGNLHSLKEPSSAWGSRLCRHTSPVKEGYAADSVNHMSEQPLGISFSLPSHPFSFLLSLLSSSIFGVNPSLINHFFLKLSMSACSSVRPYDKSFANISGTFGGLFVPKIASCWFLFKRASSLAICEWGLLKASTRVFR